MATPPQTSRRLCKALLTGKHEGDICPYYTGGPFYEHFCVKHTSKKRVEPDPETCTVCFETMPVEFRTSCCKSVFCRSCLIKHIKAGGTTCPKCRAPMGLALDSVEYQWLNLRYHAKQFSKRVKDAAYLTSQETLNTHILSCFDAQKEEALAHAKQAYEAHIKEIEEAYQTQCNAWNNNTEQYRDELWSHAQHIRHTVSNVSLLRSSRYPDALMAEAGLNMIHEATAVMDEILESKDMLGLLYSEDEEAEFQEMVVEAVREHLNQRTPTRDEDDNDDNDDDDDDDEEWEDIDD